MSEANTWKCPDCNRILEVGVPCPDKHIEAIIGYAHGIKDEWRTDIYDFAFAVIEFCQDIRKDRDKTKAWIQKAIPFLKSELWRVSDCLALPTPTGLGEDFDAEIDKKLEEDHAILTELLKEVGALEE